MTSRAACFAIVAFSLLAAAAAPALADDTPRAGSIQAVRATAESALTVTGTIDVDAGGRVVAWTLDQPEKLPPGVVKMAGDNVPTWTFAPAVLPAGTPASRMRMSMLFVAREVSRGKHEISLRYPSFAPLDPGPQVSRLPGGRAIAYPYRATQYGVTGTVYLLLRIDGAGNVTDALVEQVNLGVVDTERNMATWRELLGNAALKGAREMQFQVPEGVIGQGQTTVARLPVAFVLDTDKRSAYGRWYAYVPGPRANIPWPEAAGLVATAPDALPPNVLQTDDSRVRQLVSPSPR